MKLLNEHIAVMTGQENGMRQNIEFLIMKLALQI